MVAFSDCGPGGVDMTDVTIEGRHGDIPARGYRGSTSPSGAALVWVHGGGFVGGDLDMPEAHWVGVELARRGIPVLSVDYRKCPDGVHYPVPLEDVLDAWLWVTALEPGFGVTADKLHLGGASAGAHLCAGVTKRLRDECGPLPASLVLAYPNLHAQSPPFSEELRAALAARRPDFVFTTDVMRSINLNFVGDEALLDDDYAFPANGEVSGQPPVFILNSEADSLRASGEAYSAQLADAAVPVRVEHEPGTLHGHLNDPDSPAAQRSIERLASWVLEWTGS